MKWNLCKLCWAKIQIATTIPAGWASAISSRNLAVGGCLASK